ncbi:MAG: M16 family metallopeptidase, partial [Acidimicrobiales bacterium]
TVFGKTGLGRDVIGTAATIAGLTADDIEGWFRGRYRRSSIVVAAAGAVDHDELVAEVEQRWQVAGPDAHREFGAEWQSTRRATLARDSEQAQIMIAFPGLRFGDDRRYATAIGNQVFGGGLSSRLFQRIREQRGLAYSVYSGSVSFADTGMVVIGGATASERLDELEEALRREILDVVDNGISESELQTAKDAIAGSYELSFDDVSSRMSQLGATVLHEDRLPDNDGDIERVLGLSRNEVNDTFSALISAQDTTVVVGPNTSKP